MTHIRGGLLAVLIATMLLMLSPQNRTAEAQTVAATASSRSFVTRSGDSLVLDQTPFRFVGANIYWLALDEHVGIAFPTHDRVDRVFTDLRSLNGTVARCISCGADVGGDLSLEPRRGSYSEQAFQADDYAVKSARDHGIRLVISLVDNWHYYTGGRHTYTDWRGIGDENQFYYNRQVIADFEDHIDHVLNRINTLTGQPYKDDSTIMAWETGNELNTAPRSWVQAICDHVKSVAPKQLCMDGRYHTPQEDLSIASLDIAQSHFYPLDSGRLRSEAAEAAAAGKAYVVGEFGWNNPISALPGFLNTIEQTRAAGDLVWSLFDGSVTHGDGYTLHVGGSSQDMQTAAQLIQLHASRFVTSRGAPSLPPLPSAPASSSPSRVAIVVVQPCTLSASAVAPGDTLTARSTIRNQGADSVRLRAIVLAGRPPGGHRIGGPFTDFSPAVNDVIVAPGQSYTLIGSRSFTASDSLGTGWNCYVTYQTIDGGWHDDASDTRFNVGMVTMVPGPLEASACQLSRSTVVAGESLQATATLTNRRSSSISIQNVVLAGRPPGGTHDGGPWDDFSPGSGTVTLAPGQAYTLVAKRSIGSSDPRGAWYCFVTYHTTDGVWHDDPHNAQFLVR